MAANTQNRSGRGNHWRTAIWGIAASLLLPAIAMQFTREVNWDKTDFITMGIILAAACGICESGARMSSSTAYRAAMGIAAVAGFLLVWINLAVGIIGHDGNPANLMYGGVLLVAIIGALIARFQSHGMARALMVTAIATALVAVIVLIAGLGYEASMLTGFFSALWLTSAWLFRKAAREQSLSGAGR